MEYTGDSFDIRNHSSGKSELEKLCGHIRAEKEQSKEFGEIKIIPTGISSNQYRVINYYCKLTGKLCVGSIKEEYLNLDLINPEIVSRCPSNEGYKL